MGLEALPSPLEIFVAYSRVTDTIMRSTSNGMEEFVGDVGRKWHH